MDTTKQFVRQMRLTCLCPECRRPMMYRAETPNIRAFWRCTCGYSEPAIDPRQVRPVANQETRPI